MTGHRTTPIDATAAKLLPSVANPRPMSSRTSLKGCYDRATRNVRWIPDRGRNSSHRMTFGPAPSRAIRPSMLRERSWFDKNLKDPLAAPIPSEPAPGHRGPAGELGRPAGWCRLFNLITESNPSCPTARAELRSRRSVWAVPTTGAIFGHRRVRGYRQVRRRQSAGRPWGAHRPPRRTGCTAARASRSSCNRSGGTSPAAEPRNSAGKIVRHPVGAQRQIDAVVKPPVAVGLTVGEPPAVTRSVRQDVQQTRGRVMVAQEPRLRPGRRRAWPRSGSSSTIVLDMLVLRVLRTPGHTFRSRIRSTKRDRLGLAGRPTDRARWVVQR